MSYDAVVFDNDGVLVEPSDPTLLQEAIRESFAEFDADPTPAHVERMFSGVTVETLEAVAAAHGVDHESLWRARDTNNSRVQREAIREGAKAPYPDVEAVWDLDVPLGIVSSNQHATVEFILDYHGWRGRFETYYGRRPTVEDIRRKKPNPHFIERALADLGTTNALYVGDRETDVQAARAAGVDSAFLRRERWADRPLSVEPTYEFETLHPLRDLV